MEEKGIRLNKYLSDAGICSRREADGLIAEGKVTVNGVVAAFGVRVLPGDQVLLDGKKIGGSKEQILIAYNKPQGVECTSDKRNPNNIFVYFQYPKRLIYVGRLDKQSEGLLLFTNDGDLANAIAKAGNYHEKEYVVRVNKPVTNGFLKALSEGVTIEIDEKEYDTRPCKVKKRGSHGFSIVLTQGFNRQIRRMCQELGYHVVSLKRVRVMNITLGDLKTGAYRVITGQEKELLLESLKKAERKASS